MRIMLVISLGILPPLLVNNSTVFSVGANFSFNGSVICGKNFVYSTLEEVFNFSVLLFYE